MINMLNQSFPPGSGTDGSLVSIPNGTWVKKESA